MVSASNRAASSGSTVKPPRKLKPCKAGTLQESGLPASRKAMAGSRITRAATQRQNGKILPVSA
ncbi:hypothetical protein D3C80_835660 [compost metagenome]